MVGSVGRWTDSWCAAIVSILSLLKCESTKVSRASTTDIDFRREKILITLPLDWLVALLAVENHLYSIRPAELNSHA